jgi:osmotically-inducible protein OsmY
MKVLHRTLARSGLALALLASLPGCIPVMIGGTGVAVAMATDRRSSGTYVEDEGMEWKAGNWISERLDDNVHASVTSFNRKLLLTGEAFNEDSRQEAGRLAAKVENVREVFNELRIAPTSAITARNNDSYISSKVKLRFIDQKVFRPQHVKVVTEAGNVYLMGLVTQREGDAATEIARTTSEVRKVVKMFEYISEDEARRLDHTLGDDAAARPASVRP